MNAIAICAAPTVLAIITAMENIEAADSIAEKIVYKWNKELLRGCNE